ncbi:hypothetical protein ACFLS9_05375 [Bacteroidota bacterium]
MKFFVLFISILYSGFSLAQNLSTLKVLKEKYESFEYDSVIVIANDILTNIDTINNSQRIEIYTYISLAHYALGNNEAAKSSFTVILSIDKNYQLDPTAVSPKIITFYNEVRKTYKDINEVTDDNTSSINDANLPNSRFIQIEKNLIRNSMIHSVILPGWGHLYLENNTKGWFLTTASSVTLGSMIYYIFDTNSKEEKYLNETRDTFIETKYNDYNSAYKIRNVLIISYLIIWVYSQIDLLFFSDTIFINKINSVLNTQVKTEYPNSLIFSLRIPF